VNIDGLRPAGEIRFLNSPFTLHYSPFPMNPLLSLLICHLGDRHRELARLTERINQQIGPFQTRVEILINEDNGERTTGEKRQELLRLASGDWTAFIDDDDLIAEDYIPRVLEALRQDPDVVGLEGIMTRGGDHPQKFIHSLKYDHWFDEGIFPNKVYYRCPNHLNPVRRRLARQAGFPPVTIGEDKSYSDRLFPLLKTEVYLERPIYFYLAE
jgi:glycosyltransferase involved in cell wall biosynthesis